MERSESGRGKPAVGYGTEYTENFAWDADKAGASTRSREASGLFQGSTGKVYPVGGDGGAAMATMGVPMMGEVRDPSVFPSQIYPSVYRETVIRKDDRGKYIDPFKNISTKPYGRRLMYDPSHPDKMYPSQWSSELADAPGCYSFPTTTGLDQEIPFRRDLQWQVNAETGEWPTDQWKHWTQVACSPPYDGHDDQLQYSQYKVQVP